MSHSERTQARPSTSSSRSGPPTYTSLISTSPKENFRDTLLVNRSTGVPSYATITEADTTSLYAIDSNMMLQRIATVNWGGKSVHATVTNGVDQTSLLNNILIKGSNQGAFNSMFAPLEADQLYSYGQFACKWSEDTSDRMSLYTDMSRINCVCYGYAPQRSARASNPATSLPAASFLPQGPDQVPQALATLVFCSIPSRPKVKIDVHARQLLRQDVGEDGFTALDHIVLSALLTIMSGGRKPGRAPAGWLNQAQLQERLLAQHRALCPNRSTDTLPLYQVPSSQEGGPPPYTSRLSLVSTRSMTR